MDQYTIGKYMRWLLMLLLISPTLLAQPPLPLLKDRLNVQPIVPALVFSDKTGPVFTLKGVRIEGQRNQISVQHGTQVKMEFKYRFHCKHCKRPYNQLLIGLNFQHSAQICLYNGKGSSSWKKATVSINIPDLEGNYYIRARHSDAFNCKDALDWWRLDLPLGPNERANIGMVQVIKSKINFTSSQ